jgi:hypothetical protein
MRTSGKETGKGEWQLGIEKVSPDEIPSQQEPRPETGNSCN